MTKRTLYPIVFALLLLLGGWGSKASGQSRGATYAVRYTLPKGVSDLRCVTSLPRKGKVVVTSGRKLPAGVQLTFTATVEAGYEIDHWTVNGDLAQHEPDAKIMEMEMPEEDIDVVIVMKQPETPPTEECTVRLTPSTPDGGMLSAYYLERNPYTGEEDATYIDDGDRVPKNTQLKATAVPNSGYTIGQWYQDGATIEGSKGKESVSVVVRDNTEIKVDFESSGQSFEGVVFTFQEDTPEGTITAYYEDDNFNHKAFHSGDKVPMDKMAYFTATPKAGYEFDYWTLNGEKESRYLMIVDEHTCKLTAEEDDTIGAVFKRTAPAGHKITLTAGEGGTLQCFLTNGTEVQSGSTVDDGVALRFNARPKSGYKTDQWTINGEPFAKGKGKNTITQKADKPLNVEVSFLKDIELYTVEYVAEAGGTIKSATYYDRTTYDYVDFQSGKELPKDSEVDIEVEPKAGYVVDLWYLNDQPIDASKGKTSQTITISQNSKIRITFATKPKQTVTYTASTGGTIQGTLLGTAFDSGAKLDEGSYIIFTATPDKGYEVDQWSIDGEVVTRYAGKKEITERLGNKPLKVEVSFKKLPVTYEVTYSAGEGGDIVGANYDSREVIPSGSKVKENDFMRFTAKPNTAQGYKVDQWFVNGQVQTQLTGSLNITWQIKAKTDVKVTFKKEQMYEVDYKPDNEWGTIEAYYYDGGRKVTVEPKAKVKEGTIVEFQATVKEGYALDGWTNNGHEIPVADIETHKASLTLRANAVIDVKYHKLVVKHAVTFTAGEGGTIAATVGAEAKAIQSKDQVEQGAVITFTATPQEGYELDQWMVNDKPAVAGADTKIEGNKLIVTLGDQDLKVEATFKKVIVKHPVTFTAGEGGAIAATVGAEAKAIQSNDQVEQGAVITFTATPQEGYELDHWMVNGNPAVAGADTKIEGNKLIVTLGDQDLKVEATFKKVIVKHTVTFTAGEGGTIAATVGAEAKAIQSNDQVEQGAVITFTATPQEGYELDQWMVNGKPAVAGADTKIEGNKLIVTLGDQDLKVEATFKKVIVKHTVTFTAGEGGAIAATVGTEAKAIQSNDQVEQGAVITFTATPQEGYELDQWMVNGKPAVAGADTKIEGNKLIVTLGDQDLKVEATFKKVIVKHPVTFTAGEGGAIAATVGTEAKAIQSNDQVEQGAVITFTATPQEGYELDQWMVNDKPAVAGADTKIEGNKLIVTLGDQDLKVEATFKKVIVKHPVTFTAGEGGAIAATVGAEAKAIQSNDQVEQGAVITFTATPQEGYELDQWMVNDKPAVAGADTKIEGNKLIVTLGDQDLKVEATFKKVIVKHTVTFTAGEGGAIAATVGAEAKAIQSKDQVEQSAVITFTATPQEGYELDQWMVNDNPAVAGADTKIEGNKLIVTLGDQDLKVEVSFKKLPVTFPVVFTAGEGGTIVATVADGSAQKTITSGDAIVQYSRVTFTAKPESGYLVDQWTVNDQPQQFFAGKPELTRSVREALKVHVTFKEDKPAKLCTINYTKENEWGTLVAYYDTQASGRINVKPGDKVEEGYMITFLATPKEGYTIDHWTYNGNKTPTVKPEMLTVKVTEDMTVAVVCNKAKLCAVTFDAVSEGGKMTASYLKDEGFNGYKDVYIKSGDQVPAGTEVTFVVTLTEGYTLEHWLVNNTKKACDKYNPLRLRELVINEDTEVKAVYKAPQKPQHAVTFTAGEGGTIAATVGAEAKAIQSNDQVEQGAVITFTATPQEGYELDQWMVNGERAVAGADTKIEGNKLIVTLGDQDLKVEATFKKLPVTYEVTYSAGEGGDIVGATFNGRTTIPSGSKVDENVYMRFTAMPNTEQDYKVDQWIVNGEVQSQLAGRAFIMWQIKAKTDVKVTFKKEQMYEVNYKPDNEWGTIEAYYYDRGRKVAVEPKAMIKEGTFVEFQATVKDGYVLDAWTNNGEEIPVADIETLKANITLRANAVIDVKYHKLVVKHAVTFTAGEGGAIAATVGTEAKAIQSNDQVEQGAVITFTATPQEGYELDQWMVNDKPAVAGADTKIEGNKLIVTLGDQDLKVQATFKKLIVKHTVTFTAGEGGTIAATVGAEAKAIQSNDQVEQGAVITFTATPQEGYELDHWMVNGKPAVAGADTKIEGNKLIVTLGDQDLKVKVTFKKLIVKHAVTFTAGEGGAIAATVGPDAKAIQSKDQVEQGAVITFTATPQKGYELDQWMVNGKPAVAGADTKIEGNKLIVTLGDQDLKVEATFKKLIVKHTVTFTAGEGGTIAATVGAEAKAIQSKDQVEQGAVITFTATPQEGYELDQWMVNDKPAVAGADTKIEGNKLIVTLGDQDLKVQATFKKVNAISQISEAGLAVYPNPFAERIVITIPAECIGQTAYLTSMQGEIVLQMTLEQTETVLYTDALSQGTYLLRVGSQSQLLIKE